MKQFPDLKTISKWLKNPKNKKITYLFIFFVFGLLFLTLNKFVFETSSIDETPLDKKLDQREEKLLNSKDEHLSYESMLENKLIRVLNNIDGIENVDVVITLDNQAQIQPAFNTIDTEKNSQEKDNEGGVRTITENQSNKQIVIMRKNGEEEPVVIKKVAPKVNGVLISAEGVISSETIDKLIKATATLFNIPIYKISVITK